MTKDAHPRMNHHTNASVLSACNTVVLKSMSPDQDAQKAVVLAAWAVLLRDYRAPHTPTFAHITERERHQLTEDRRPYPDGLRCQRVFIPFETDATIEQLKETTLQTIQGNDWTDLATCKDITAAAIFPKRQTQISAQLLALLEVELLLVVSETNECSIFNDKSKKPEFQLNGLLQSFSNIYNTFLEEPTLSVLEISAVTSFDVGKFQEINGGRKKSANGSPKCLHVLINENYHRRGESIALASTSEEVTYAQLGKASAATAHHLKKMGINAGETVGVCMDRSIFTIVTIVGILRAGAAYAPIDPTSPIGRISQVVQRADIKFLVTEDQLCGKFQDLEATLVTSSQLKNAETPENWLEEANIDAAKPVYFMFTSGSTGIPKGVIHGHGAVSISLIECIKHLGIDTSTRYMQSASLAFDASILEVFAPLVAGGCLCMISKEERDNDLESVMEGLKVSHAWLTPSMVAQIEPDSLPSLRSLSVGGEPPSAELLSIWGERVELNNLYGTTEAGVWDTAKRGIKAGDNPKNIGQGIGNTACWITDPSDVQRLMPFGAEGEMLIQSPYLAIGYLKDLEREQQALLHPSRLRWAPFMPPMEGSRVYRTGDLAKFDGNGDVIFLGRQTGYVKIRGLRVDLGEVETAINSCLKSGRSAVILSEHEGQDTEIVAFVETTDYPDDQLAGQMDDKLSLLLPKYMIPTAFVPTDSMPLTLSKKINRQELRSLLSKMNKNDLQVCRKGGSSILDCSEIPEGRKLAIEISKLIAAMFENTDSEFASSLRGKNFPLSKIGLTSMQLVSIVNLIRKRYNKKISIEDLQQNDLNVYNLEDFLAGRKGIQRQISYARDLIDDLAKLKPKLEFVKHREATVFLTSITGFLGSQILRTLLENPNIKCVIGLVRARDEKHAQEKVQNYGRLGRWWNPAYLDRIEFWTGDLSKPKLGLEDAKWDRLFSTDPNQSVDGIIHNGARVNWMETYEDLKLVNIHSTVDILSGLSKMDSPCPLIYVSGGYMPMKPESDYQIAKRLSEASGYDQTKFMSQLLLTEYNRHLDRSESTGERARTVIPGFIVGTQKEGIAHTEDFFWRFAFSIARLRCVSDNLQYLTVAGVDQVSNLITDAFLEPEKYTSETMCCVDGVRVATLCEVLSKHMDISIKKMDHQEWMELLRKDVEEADFDHPFMPVLSWFKENIWQFECDPDSIPENRYFTSEETISALGRSVKYMMNIGYLSKELNQNKVNSSTIFSRSSS
ncbi:hypothetical protein N7541_005363 [Penicillium brevicompactum]|uniref:Uncharacterized protein n=1 Tax=Penicillium brevicompactum TaxID=5074 RepID=A0A9W9RDD2_PENBR|nr:hypothetical protein N7541_005363 [Penicillium brevicompactum]